MLKKITYLFVLVLFASTIQAQWTNMGAWPDDSWLSASGAHGIAVDPDGKVWVTDFGSTEQEVTAEGDTIAIRAIYIFNDDGTQASFSPITKIDRGTDGIDTLVNSNRGLRADANGNIIAASFDRIYVLDYQDGSMITWWEPQDGASLTAAAVDDNNNMYTAHVVGDNPIRIYDATYTFVGNAIDATVGFSRAFEVSGDGNTIYWAGYTNGHIKIYTRPDEFSGYDSTNVIEGARSESFGWQPGTGLLWFSGGSYNDLPDAPFSPGVWYGWNPTTEAVVDSFAWEFTTPENANERPRAIAFSPDGNTAYVGCFGESGFPLVQKFVKSAVGVEKLDELPNGYELSQNYPNPFNPTTNIKFSIPESGFVNLKIYNSLGQEVATLVNEFKNSGTYEVDFNGSNLSSGMYVYILNSGNVNITKKMILMK